MAARPSTDSSLASRQVISGKPRRFLGEIAPPTTLDQLFHKKPVSKHVTEFGTLFSLIFALVAIYLLYKEKSPQSIVIITVISSFFLLSGKYLPGLLLPVWQFWMRFAVVLGIVMNFVILSLVWISMVVPMGMFLKLIRKRVMDCDFRSKKASYWSEYKSERNDFQKMTRQF
jgi:hypothetical protein